MDNRLNKFALCLLWACAGAAVAAAGASAQTTAVYDAAFGANFMDPVAFWGWTPHNVAAGFGSGVPLTPDPGTGLNAWSIDDNAASTVNPFYSQCVDAPQANGACSVGPVRDAAEQSGWRYSTKARFAVDHGTSASMGLSLWMDNHGYFVLFDLDANNNLQATLINPNTTIALTTGGVSATAYHDIALVYLPATQRVAFEFDGVVRGFTTGSSQIHDNAMLWGNLSTSGRGQMNFNRVEFQVLLPGDYNRSGLVDAADYTLWRNSLGTNLAAADGDGNGTVGAPDYTFWKTRFGTRSTLNVGSGGVTTAPEPSGLVVPLVGMAGIFSLLRRRVASPPSVNQSVAPRIGAWQSLTPWRSSASG